MKFIKRNIGIFIILLLLILIIVGICIRKYKFYYENKDSVVFKQEYEELNNTIRETDGQKYNNVYIDSKNPIKYVTVKEAIDIIKNKSGIMYFGANWCPWCRNAVPVLIEASAKNNNMTIYYLNMDKVRNIWEVNDGKLEKTREEEDGYYELLELLDSILDEDTYKITDNEKEYDTEEKRIYMPLVVAISNGKIIDHHDGTVELNDDQNKYDSLTEEQHKELLNVYTKMFESVKSETCDDKKCS